jgi:hypothetical protein
VVSSSGADRGRWRWRWRWGKMGRKYLRQGEKEEWQGGRRHSAGDWAHCSVALHPRRWCGRDVRLGRARSERSPRALSECPGRERGRATLNQIGQWAGPVQSGPALFTWAGPVNFPIDFKYPNFEITINSLLCPKFSKHGMLIDKFN